MHGNRFFIRAGHPPAKAQGICRASASFTRLNRYVVHNPRRSCCNRVSALVPAPDRRPNSLGTGPHVAPRERAALYPCAARLWRRPSCVAGHCQPCPRCALGDGGRGRLRRTVCRHWRNSWRTSSTRFHRDQAVGNARRGLRRACHPAAQRRPRCVECSPRKVAHNVPAIPHTSTRQPRTWHPTMGFGPVSHPQPDTCTMGGAI